MDLTLTLTLLVTAFGCIYLYLKHLFSYWKRKGVPYIEPTIPFGNVTEAGRTEQSALTFERVYKQLKGKGPIGGLYFLTSPVPIILDISLIKQILIKDFQYFVDRGSYYNEKYDPLSAHLFALEGDRWRQLRNKLSPTFTSGKMKFMFPIVVNVAKQFEKFLIEKIKESGELEVKDPLARYTTDVIGTCAFGIECNTIAESNTEFLRMGRKALEEPPLPNILLFFITAYPNFGRKLGLKITANDVSNFFLRIVRETVNYREANNVQRNDFMDILLKLKNSETNTLTLNEISAQAFLFFLGGFETSSTTLTFCLYELAKNPDVQKKVRNEIKSVIEKHGELTYEAMMEMNYLDQAIYETLRMYPPVGNLVRKANTDYNVPGTDIIIKKGMLTLIPAFGIQRDPEFFPDPEKFIPERFSPEEKEKRDSITFLSFGDGPRNCVGLRFGMMQVRIGLVTILQNFEISTSSNTIIPMKYKIESFVLTPQSGVFLNFKKI